VRLRLRVMKGHGNPFPVTIDALVGAGFPLILGWCRHDDSHFLRALWTKQHPGVSSDCLVRHMRLHGHDNSPSVGKRLGPIAESRLYKIAQCNLLCDLSFVCLIQRSSIPDLGIGGYPLIALQIHRRSTLLSFNLQS
jgi:hypothetical protein